MKPNPLLPPVFEDFGLEPFAYRLPGLCRFNVDLLKAKRYLSS